MGDVMGKGIDYPSIKQAVSPDVAAARRDAELELQVHLAHAAALLMRPKACRKALARAAALQQQAEVE